MARDSASRSVCRVFAVASWKLSSLGEDECLSAWLLCEDKKISSSWPVAYHGVARTMRGKNMAQSGSGATADETSCAPNKWASLIHRIGRVYSKCGAQESLPPGRRRTFAELNPVSGPFSFSHSPLSAFPFFPPSFGIKWRSELPLFVKLIW